MIPVRTTRRRADAFDALVGAAVPGGRAAARDAELLDVVASLRDLAPVHPRPEFVTGLREQLMAAADIMLVPSEQDRLVLPARTPARDRRVSVAVGGLALVGATTSVAMAAQSALPGDALYPVKRALENAQTGLAPDERDKGAMLLASAADRLDEVTALTREGRVEDGRAIAETLDSFAEQARVASQLLLADYAETGSESSVSELRGFTSDSMLALAELEAVVPIDARDELVDAAHLLTQIDADAARACPECSGLGITEIPAILTAAGLLVGDGAAASSSAAPVGVPAAEPAAAAAGSPAVAPSSQVQQAKNRKGDGRERLPSTALPAAAGRPLPPGSVLEQPPGGRPEADPGVGADVDTGRDTGKGTDVDTDVDTDRGAGKGTQTVAPARNPLGDIADDVKEQGDAGAALDPSIADAPGIKKDLQRVTEPLSGVQKP